MTIAQQSTLAFDYEQVAVVIPRTTTLAQTLRTQLNLTLPGKAFLAAIKPNTLLGIRIVGHSAAYFWGKDAARAVIPVLLTSIDLAEPIMGASMLDSFFVAAVDTDVTAQLVAYFTP